MKVCLLDQAVKGFQFPLRRAIFLLLFDSSPRDWMPYWCSHLPFPRHNNIMTTEYASHSILGYLLYVQMCHYVNKKKRQEHALLSARIMDVEFDAIKTLYNIKNNVGQHSGTAASGSFQSLGYHMYGVSYVVCMSVWVFSGSSWFLPPFKHILVVGVCVYGALGLTRLYSCPVFL